MPLRSQEPERRDDEDSGRTTASLAGLALILLLLVLALLLVRALLRESSREDCLMAGLRTCQQIDSAATR